MADAFIGEIRIFAGNFPPSGWALCNGQLLPISQNPALFSILGVQYGGDGRTTFALPNLMGRVPIHQGAGAGLTPRSMGQVVGQQTVTLLSTEMPAHTHTPMANSVFGTSGDPTNSLWSVGKVGRSGEEQLYATTPDTPMAIEALTATGGNQPHNNMQPYLVMNYIICLDGEFPSRG